MRIIHEILELKQSNLMMQLSEEISPWSSRRDNILLMASPNDTLMVKDLQAKSNSGQNLNMIEQKNNSNLMFKIEKASPKRFK